MNSDSPATALAGVGAFMPTGLIPFVMGWLETPVQSLLSDVMGPFKRICSAARALGLSPP